MIKKIFSHALGAAFLALAFAFVSAPRSAAATASSSVVEVTFPGAASFSGSLTNFPVAIRIANDSPAGFSYATCPSPDGICIYADENCLEELPYEIEWNPQGESVAWVKIPEFTKNTKVYMVWKSNGDIFARTTQPKDVWSDYLGVWHMNDESLRVVADSAHHKETFDMNGAASVDKTTSPTQKKIGSSLAIQGSVKVQEYSSLSKNPRMFSVSGWFYWPGYSTANWDNPALKGDYGNTGWYIYMDRNTTRGGVNGQGAGIIGSNAYFNDVTKNWNHYVLTCDGTTMTLYVNGISRGSANISSRNKIEGPDKALELYARNGYLDETRVYDGCLTAARVAQEYAMQNATGYSTFGEVKSGYFLPSGQTLVWNGKEQVGVPLSDFYTVTGGTATDVGTYTATVRLNDPTTMKWIDTGSSADRTVEWSIEKLVVEQPTAIPYIIYDGTPKTGVVEDPDRYVLTGHTATEVGRYFATVKLKNPAMEVWCDTKTSEERKILWSISGREIIPYRQVAITFPGAKELEGVLVDFPVAVRLGENKPEGFSYGALRSPEDIRFFADADGQGELPFELEWDAGGETVAWVKIPSFCKPTTIYMRWYLYNAPPAHTKAAKDVWSDYLGVWHMNDETGTKVSDSALTMEGMDGIVVDGFVSESTNCKIGRSIHTDAVNSSIKVKDYASRISNNKFSVSGWFLWSEKMDYNSYLCPFTKGNWSDKNGCYIELYQGYDKIHIAIPQDSGEYVQVLKDVRYNWNHFAFTCDGTTTRLYINGGKVPATSRAVGGKPVTGSGLDMSMTFQGGSRDETRVYNGVLEPERIAQEYAMQNADGYSAFGATSYERGYFPPRAVKGLVYDGTVKIGVPEDDYYVLEGEGKATASGTYRVTAKISDPNVVWSDTGTIEDRPIEWTIAKGSNEWTRKPSLVATIYAKSLPPALIPAVAKFGEVKCYIDGVEWQEGVTSTVAPTHGSLSVGKHTLTYKVAKTSNWDNDITATIDFEIVDDTKSFIGRMNSVGASEVKWMDNGEFMLVFTNTEALASVRLDGRARGQLLVVGGGGAGGPMIGGGGGGGGVIYHDDITLAPGVYSIKVGKGGKGLATRPSEDANGWYGAGANGDDSYFSSAIDTYVAYGGGGGGGASSRPSNQWRDSGAGGSSGGATQGRNAAKAKDLAQGNNGGNGSAGNYAGGGGGAAGAGTNGSAEAAGDGGAGRLISIDGKNVYYGAGGGASRVGGNNGIVKTAASGGEGGQGGGGAGATKYASGGSTDPDAYGKPGTSWGAGGGGSGVDDNPGSLNYVKNGVGYQGIVILRIKSIVDDDRVPAWKDKIELSINGRLSYLKDGDALLCFEESAFGDASLTFDDDALVREVLLVGGGGGGGNTFGGGGGGGGFLSRRDFTVPAGHYTVTVGKGGSSAGGNGGQTALIPKNGGGPFEGLIAPGGGGGAAGNGDNVGKAGGSGGGGGGNVNTAAAKLGGAALDPDLGNSGGSGYYNGGGGGGASAIGGNGGTGNWSSGGTGGAGKLSSISGKIVTYAGGGGGGSVSNSSGGGGGAGGGGRGGNGTPSTAGTNGTNGLGGGGGGGGNGRAGGTGGSGIIYLKVSSLGSVDPKEPAWSSLVDVENALDVRYIIEGQHQEMIARFVDTAKPGKLSVRGTASFEFLVVGGGGAGGAPRGTKAGGGGGAGGFVEGKASVEQTTPYEELNFDITVGAGGVSSATANDMTGSMGKDSVLVGGGVEYRGLGGGAGGYYIHGGSPQGWGGAGGSGGGATHLQAHGNATQPFSSFGGFGNAGGVCVNAEIGSGGGGATVSGHGQISGDVTGVEGYVLPSGKICIGAAGSGGDGRISVITGDAVYYAGGGGGGGTISGDNVYAGGLGGIGGGGRGGCSVDNNDSTCAATAGASYTGGGGGGGCNTSGGRGGSGIVIVRVKNVEALDIPNPGAIQGLVYDGTEQFGVVEHPKFYTIEGGSGTTVGTYRATLTLVNDINRWANVSSAERRSVHVEWTIAKAPNAVDTPYSMTWREDLTPGEPAADATFGTPRFVWAAAEGDERDLKWHDWDATKEDGRPRTAGEYWLKAIVDEGDNWYGAESEWGRITVEPSEAPLFNSLAYESLLSVDGYTGTETLDGFVLLVRIAEDEPKGFHYRDTAANGADIRFSDGNNTKNRQTYPCEIDSWDDFGTSYVWVRLPTMEASQKLTMHWGRVEGEKLPSNDPTKVWQGYAGVWHFDELTGAVADATGFGRTAEPDSPDMTATEGWFGRGWVNGFADSPEGNRFNVTEGASLDLGDTFTFTGYFRDEYFAAEGSPVLVSRKDYLGDGWEISLDRATKEVVVSGAGTTSVKAPFDLTTAPPQPVAKTLLKSSARLALNAAPLLGATASQDGDIEMGMDGLPFGFTRLEWIKSTREQVIVTDYLPNPKTVLKLELEMSGDFKNSNNTGTFPATPIPGSSETFTDTASIFGCNDSTVAAYSMNYGGDSGQKNKVFPWTNNGYQSGKGETAYESDIGEEHKSRKLVTVNSTAGTKKLTWGSKSFPINEKQTTHKTHPLALFGQTGYTQYCQARPFGCYEMTLYSAQILEGGELKADFIPCRSESGEVGLYDRVGGKFYGNYLSEPDALFDGAKGIAWAESKFVAGPELVELDYVQSTGYEYVDLGVKPGKDTRVVIRYSPSGPNSSWLLAYGANNSGPSLMLYKTSNGLQITQNDSYNATVTYSKGGTQDVEYTLDVSNSKWVLDGETLPDANPKLTQTCAGNAYLFAMHQGWAPDGVNGNAGTWAQMKVMRCQFYEGATLTHDFKPVKYVDGSTEKVGLWDAVELKLLTSATAQPLQAGPERIFATPDKMLDRATVVLDTAVFEYDGASHTPRITVATNEVTVVEKLTAAEINAGSYGFTAAWSPEGTTDPGTYYLILKGDNERFYGTNSKKSFEIHIDPSRRLENATVTLEKPSATYDGLAHDPLITVTTGGVAVASALTAAEINTRHLGFTASWSPSEIKAPGAYTLTLTGDKVAFTGTSAPVRFLIASYHRLDVTFDASAGDGKTAVTIYVDGKEEGSGPITVTGAGSALAFGGRSGAVSFGGDLDEFRLRPGLIDEVQYALDLRQSQPPSAGGEPIYAAGEAVRKVEDRTLANRWLVAPTISKTQWNEGEAPATTNACLAAHGEVKVSYLDGASGKAVPEMPTAVGVWTIVFRAEAEGYAPLEARCQFRITKPSHSYSVLGDGRTLLFNDDPTAAAPIAGQGYDCTNAEAEAHWEHSREELPGDFNFLLGTQHSYYGKDGRLLWSLDYVRIGNNYPASDNEGEQGLERYRDRLFLPWNPASAPMTGAIAGKTIGKRRRLAGQAALQNKTIAAITSGEFTNGVGQVYFDAVNAFSDFSQTNGLDVAVEVSKRLSEAELREKDIPYDSEEAWGEWKSVPLSAIRIEGEKMTKTAEGDDYARIELLDSAGVEAEEFPKTPGVIEWQCGYLQGNEPLDFPNRGKTVFAYADSLATAGSLNGIAITPTLSSAASYGSGNLTINPTFDQGSYSDFQTEKGIGAIYQKMLKCAPWGREGSGPRTLTLGNLVTGHRYLVQLVIHDDRSTYINYAVNVDGGANYYMGKSSEDAASTPYGCSFVGKFVAAGATQSLKLDFSKNNSRPQLAFIQLRDLTAEEPGAGGETSYAVDYIESTGNTWLNTGVVPDAAGQIELGFTMMKKDGNTTVACARNTTTANTFTFFGLANGSTVSGEVIRYDYNNTQKETAFNFPLATPCDITMKAGKAIFIANGETKEFPAGTDVSGFTVGGPLMLFASYTMKDGSPSDNLGNYAKARISYCRVYDRNHALMLDLIPWCRDGQACFYDKASNRYLHAGAGTLQAGPKAAIQPSPSQQHLYGGTYKNFFRLIADVNESAACRVRIRRASECADLGMDESLIMIDNLIASDPANGVELTSPGHFDPERTGAARLGYENAFTVPYPGAKSVVTYGRAQPVFRGAGSVENVQAAVMHYRWHYLNQMANDWQSVYLDPKGGFVSGEPLKFPGYEGDLEYWYELYQDAEGYSYVDYSGTGLGLGGFGGGVANVTTNGYGSGWYVRLRAGDSEYQELRLIVNNKWNDTPHAYPMRLTADHVWQAQVPVADLERDGTEIDPEDGGLFHYRVEFCNHQTPYTTDWAVNTNWYCQADDVSALPITSLLRAATDKEWSPVALDGMTDHILFQVDELSKAVSVVRANYQNFNLWTDARNDEKFQINAKENDSKTGVSPYSRAYVCDFSVFEETQSDRQLKSSETTYWKESFDLIHPVGGYPETYETAFTTPNDWKSGKGRYAYGQYRDKNKMAALEMYGQGAGSLTYDNSQRVNPRGLEKVTFNARLAQGIDFKEVCYYHCNFKDMTNYTFTAFTAFDRKGSTSFSGNGSVSLFALYQPTEGAYELRYEQTKANDMRLSLYRWGKSELKNGRPYGAITPVLIATGNSRMPNFEQQWSNVRRDKQTHGFNAPYTYESPAAEYQPLLISVRVEKNKTTIRAGVRGMGYKLSDSDEDVYFKNFGGDNSTVEWNIFEFGDETPFRMTRGSYGVLSANCPGVFAKMRFGKFFTEIRKEWGLQPIYNTCRVLPVSMKSYFASELHPCNTLDERWQAAVPGRMTPVYRADLNSEYPYQFEADPTPQDLYLYLRDRGSRDWGEPVAKRTVTGFGGSGGNFEISHAVNTPVDQDFRIAVGGEEADRPINVVVDDVTLTQWRGVDFDSRYENLQLAWETKTPGLIGEYDITNNFFFSSVWFTGKAAKLSAKRTLPDRPSGIRTPLLDGAAARGSGFGLLALDYENAQPNVKLLVQIATNESIVASNAVANLEKLNVLESEHWLTVTNFDFTAGELATKRGSGTLVYNPGLHGVKGVMRVILDPSIYPEAQATPNPAAFGEIDILKAYVIDEPELDGKCWWGWNLQTTGLEERSLLSDWEDSGLGGLALGLNNSVTEDLAETDWKLTPMYANMMPLVESPSVGTNEIASITFKARKYATDPEGREGAAQVTVFGHDRKTGEWNVMEEVVVASPVFETYTVPGDRSIDAVRLAVTGVKGVKNPGRRPLSGADPVRVLIDEIAVSEGMTPKLAFRNVAAFRTNLRNLLPVENVMDKSEQPLTGEPWGVQCELYATALADEVDYSKPIKVRLYAYRGKEPWGYENWWTNETLNVIRTELQRAEGFSTSNMIFRSSFLNGSSGIMEPELEDGTVVQYVLEASYYRLGNDRVITEMLGPGNWTTPKWYQPLDFNREYGSFSAYTIIDTVSPGWAWINEVNVFGPSPTHNPDEMYDNFADICQYIEIAAPMEADLTGWKLNVISYERREPCANTLATFGYGGLAGTKPGLKGSAANMVFRVIANPKAMYDPMFDTSKGTLDAYWKLTKAMDRDLCYENDGNFDPLVATVIELVRPSGIVESAVASIGKEFFMIIGGGGVTPQEEIATKVKKYYGLETVTPSPADTNYYQYAQGVEASVGVMLHNGEYVTDWFSDMKKTPGTLNERLDENGETVKQYIDPNHPMPNPDSIIVYAYVDETIGALRQSVSETEAPTNLNRVVYLSLTNDSEVVGGYDIFHGLDIVYEVDPWYEMGEGSVEVTETNATYYATVTPVEGRERTYRVNVAKGSSNNVVVVARPRLNEKLREYGLTEDNRYTPAVLDWLRRHKRLAPDGKTEIEFGSDAEDLYLADYVPWGAPDKVCGQLTLTQMYWLDIDPTVSGQVFRAGFSSAPAPDWRETVRVSSNKYGEVWTEYVTNHFQTMGVSMMISNRYDATQAPYAPYVIRGVEAGSNTLGYESGPDKESWYDTTFSILGRLNIFDPKTQENWKPMRWFVFKPGSFDADFETKIEILDLYEPGSIAQAHWSEYLRDEEKKYGLFFQWHIGDDKNLPFEVEELKPENEFKW